jgi:hypothetical protein
MQFRHGAKQINIRPDRVIIAGWTGRDAAAVQHHIDELAAIGVAPPSQTPLFYQVASSLLTQSAQLQALGPGTSGEAEPLLISHNGALYLGLASDHTDRDLETASVAASKQACAKTCAAELWSFADVAAHIDQLTLKSWVLENGAWVPYQDGTLAQIMPLSELAQTITGPSTAMLCGTLPAIGGVRAADAFRAELGDPVTGKSMQLEYAVTPLEIIS